MSLADIHLILQDYRAHDKIVYIAGGIQYSPLNSKHGKISALIREVYSHTAIGLYTNPVRLLLSCVDNDLGFSKTQLTNNYIMRRGFLICDTKE